MSKHTESCPVWMCNPRRVHGSKKCDCICTCNTEVEEIVLKPCPFCLGKANIDRYGNRRQSTQYSCEDCGSSLETSEEFNHGGDWNDQEALTKAKEEGARELADTLKVCIERGNIETANNIINKAALAPKE